MRLYQQYFTAPTLLLASDTDPIAPFDYYAPWQSPTVTVHNISGRHHALMAVISQPEHELIQQWLALIPQSLQQTEQQAEKTTHPVAAERLLAY
ncbi:hypothetical protein WG68_13545 [Arsukibacterium ikkense]|uniref:Uncharacterized protein n=1 Tax=Arsukibacterium ikkense TaxID=336831 RepID=A0A0M2V2K7_9GAMM|nr:hypothetical protein [Arsukibacterium ikkense]KKO44851.1 hypothetical protein WG68_13545 [Arsukibacterium ikkense]